jgi:sugar lactone lactonase YvrE
MRVLHLIPLSFGLLCLSCVDSKNLKRFGCDAGEPCSENDGGPPLEDSGVSVTEPDSGTLSIDAGPPRLALLAGNIGGPGNLDGFGSDARLNGPAGVVVDSKGDVYFTDSSNHVLRKRSADGLVTTVAGQLEVPGTVDGRGSSARFSSPTGLAIDSAGTLYVADYSNHCIRKVTVDGAVSTLAGLCGTSGSIDGLRADARFLYPDSIAVGPGDVLYVADVANHVIRRVSTDGSVGTLAGVFGMSGFANGPPSVARFSSPQSIVFVPAGQYLVVSEGSAALRLVDLNGNVSTLAGDPNMSQVVDGPLNTARFGIGAALAVAKTGNILIFERSYGVLRSLSMAAGVTTIAGKPSEYGYVDGAGAQARFNFPRGLIADAMGNIFVADSSNNVLRRVDSASVVTTIAGRAAVSTRQDGIGAAAGFGFPNAVTATSSGGVLVADSSARALVSVSAAGEATALPFAPTPDGGMPAVGRIQSALVQNGGDILYVDAQVLRLFRCTGAIQKRLNDGTITTLAGSLLEPGTADGPGLSARFNCPSDIVAAADGVVYVSDTRNQTIRKMTVDGSVTTFAGAPGQVGSVDGAGQEARFNAPAGLALDTSGNLYVADSGSHLIRKITPAGVVSTVAGTPNVSGKEDGKGPLARFFNPRWLTMDGKGNLFVSDTGNHTIRKLTPDGTVTTVIGVAGKRGTILGLLPTTLASPQGIAILPNGQLAIVTANSVVVTVALSL